MSDRRAAVPRAGTNEPLLLGSAMTSGGRTHEFLDLQYIGSSAHWGSLALTKTAVFLPRASILILSWAVRKRLGKNYLPRSSCPMRTPISSLYGRKLEVIIKRVNFIYYVSLSARTVNIGIPEYSGSAFDYPSAQRDAILVCVCI
jgi:hypothetical protein